MKLKLPKRSQYFEKSDYLAARALIAMANLALSKGATPEEVKAVEKANSLGFINEPIAAAIEEALK